MVGTDEVGAGPLAGPVVAAAVFLKTESVLGRRSEKKWYYRVRDSKTVREAERISLAELVKQNAVAWAVAEVSPEEIDKVNIHRASLLAMNKAVASVLEQLSAIGESLILIDGKFTIGELGTGVNQRAVVDGDSSVLSIAAASLIAKVYRDNLMIGYAKQFPVYGFEKHKGYGTAAHFAAIRKCGTCVIHRKSFLKNLK